MHQRRSWALATAAVLALAVAAVLTRSCDSGLEGPERPTFHAAPEPRPDAPGTRSHKEARERPTDEGDAPLSASDAQPRVGGRVVIGRGGEPPGSGVFTCFQEGAPPVVIVLGNGGVFDTSLPNGGTWNLWPNQIDGDEWRGVAAPQEFEADTEFVVTLLDGWGTDGEELAIRTELGRTVHFVEVRVYSSGAPHPDGLKLIVPAPRDLRDVQTVTAGADGSVALREVDLHSDERLFVRSDGTAWEILTAPRAEVVELALPRGGSLRLRIAGWERLDRPEILATHESGLRGLFDDRAEQVIDGLLDARWEIVVRRRPWERQGLRAGGEVYARGEVVIDAEKVRELQLSADPGDVASPAAISGRLVVAPGWSWDGWSNRGDVTVEVDGVEMSTIDVERSCDVRFEPGERGEDRHGEFRIERLPPGDYELIIEPLGWTTRVTVPAADLEISVPEPAELRVRVVDAWSREELRARVSYLPEISTAAISTWFEEHRSDVFRDPSQSEFASSRGFRIRFETIPGTHAATASVPAGDGTLSALVVGQDGDVSRDYSWDLETHIDGLQPGALREVTLRAAPRGRVETTFVSGGIEFPLLPRVIELVSDDGARIKLYRKTRVPPGVWRVEPGRVHGYELVAPQTVEVLRGETTKLRVGLRPTSR